MATYPFENLIILNTLLILYYSNFHLFVKAWVFFIHLQLLTWIIHK